MKSGITLQATTAESLALAENKMLRYLLFVVLYFAQGIFQGFTMGAIPVWMAANGKSAGEVGGYVAVILVPWSFKFLIGPIIDKFTFLSMGRKRPWIIIAQLGIFFSFLSFDTLVNPLDNLTGLYVAGFIISFFTAFQDVATDGLAIEITPEIEQGRINALMWGSKVVSISIWLALGTSLINNLGLQKAVLIPATAIFLISLVIIFVREHAGEKRMPWSAGKASEQSKAIQPESLKAVFKALWKTISKRSNLWFIATVLLIQLVFVLIETLIKIFIIQEVNWTNSEVSNWVAMSVLISGIAGLFLGGFLIKRFGKSKFTYGGLSLFILLMAGMALSYSLWQNVYWIHGFTLIFFIINTLTTISILAMAMTFCQKSIAASQFTIYMAMANLGAMFGARLLGFLKERMDWPMVFVCTAGFALLAVFTFWQMKKSMKEMKLPIERRPLLLVNEI